MRSSLLMVACYLCCLSEDVFSQNACGLAEKRLSATEPCIPEPLFNYLYCLKNSGGGEVETSEKKQQDNSRAIEVNVNGSLLGVVVKPAVGGGYSKSDASKVVTEIQQKLNPDLAAICEHLANVVTRPPPPPPPRKSSLRNIQNTAFYLTEKRVDTAVVIPEDWHSQFVGQHCTVYMDVKRSLATGSLTDTHYLEGSYTISSTITSIMAQAQVYGQGTTESCQVAANRVFGAGWTKVLNVHITSRSNSESSFQVLETVQPTSGLSTPGVGQTFSDIAYLESNGHILRFEFEKIALGR